MPALSSSFVQLYSPEFLLLAVAFQVVLVVGEGGPGLAPTNVAVSVTQDCVRCLTWSTAVQLFITLEQPLGTEARTRLEELWEEVLAYGADIGQQPLDEIQARLTEFEAEVVALVEEDRRLLPPPIDLALFAVAFLRERARGRTCACVGPQV